MVGRSKIAASAQSTSNSSAAPLRAGLFTTILTFHVAVVAYGGWAHSPTFDEVAHLPAGLSHWRFGRFDLYSVNPPLVRSVSAIPLLIIEPQTDWSHYRAKYPFPPPWFLIGKEFIAVNGADAFWWFTAARWMCLPFTVLGACVCYRWASDLYGSTSGLLALSLWCFSPNLIAHGQLITPDVGATSLIVTCCYLFWRWLIQPTWGRAALCAVILGLAELAKTTAILLYAILPFLWLFWRWQKGKTTFEHPRSWRQLRQLGGMMLISIWILNIGYLFDGSFKPLGEYEFLSSTLSGVDQQTEPTAPGNRFDGTWLANVPVPLPQFYLQGIDLQKCDFEKRLWSYLRGEWQRGGWWYYYLYSMAIKVPLGTWGLAVLALICGATRRRDNWLNEFVLLVPTVIFFSFVSAQTGFSHHMRYVLPAFPFAFIWISRVICRPPVSSVWRSRVVLVCVMWMGTSSIFIYPHSLSYFNELVGGPTRGHHHLISSNIDWGQDLFYLRRWLKLHPEARPLRLAYFGNLDPQFANIDYELAPEGASWAEVASQPGRSNDFSGWWAASIHSIRNHSGEYEYFLEFEPKVRAGYSIYIYDLTSRDVEQLQQSEGSASPVSFRWSR